MTPLSLAVALAVTVLVEGAAAGLLFRRWYIVRCTALCNLATNPALNLCLWGAVRWLGAGAYAPALAALEAAAILAEGAILRALCGWSAGKAMRVSLLFNAASFLAGVALAALLG